MKTFKIRVAAAAIAVTVASWAALLIGLALLAFGISSWMAMMVEALVCATASTIGLAIRDGAKYRLAYDMGRRDTVEAFTCRRVVPLDSRDRR